MFFNILLFVFCFLYLLSILYILCFFTVLCTVSPSVYSCLFPIFIQVYRPLPLGGNPTVVNKYHIIYHTFTLADLSSMYVYNASCPDCILVHAGVKLLPFSTTD